MNGLIRPYDAKKDRASVHRILQECGWLVNGTAAADTALQFLRSLVYEFNGDAESFVTSAEAQMHYDGSVLDHAAIAAVATSRIARNLGAASTTLAAMLAEEAARGCATSGLGVFEQGFYNRLGFGSGSYEHWVSFDPAWLVELPVSATPRRFDLKSYKAIHQARLDRRKSHGAVDILPPGFTKSEMQGNKHVFCLGYKKGKSISHCVVMSGSEGENGPYTVMWLVYRSVHQFRELLGIIKGLSDQVRQVKLHEPGEIQMQDFLKKPFQLQAISRKGNFEAGIRAVAYWQVRILDLEKCIQVMRCREELNFNLVIDDPVTRFLPAKSDWKGCGGSYTVNLGPHSSVKKGASDGLETLTASIGDFTRYWLGVQAAEVLNASGLFDAPVGLLEKLDEVTQLPHPAPDWDY